MLLTKLAVPEHLAINLIARRAAIRPREHGR
jgi:hypothetical protein